MTIMEKEKKKRQKGRFWNQYVTLFRVGLKWYSFKHPTQTSLHLINIKCHLEQFTNSLSQYNQQMIHQHKHLFLDVKTQTCFRLQKAAITMTYITENNNRYSQLQIIPSVSNFSVHIINEI